MKDAQFEEQFANCTLNPDLFSHEAHLRLAWIHIGKYGLERAIKNVSAQLINFTIFLGETDKYNETVTVAAVKIVNHFRLKSHCDNFKDFIHAHPRLLNNFKELLESHYTTDIFVSEKAKKVYLKPELIPFD